MGDDVVKIGEATLYLGDALEILPTLPAGSVDMIFTDPPYGHNNNDGDLISRWEGALGRFIRPGDDRPRPIANDGPEANDLFQKFLIEAKRLLGKDGCCCCCCGGGPDPQFARWSMMMNDILTFKMMVIYDKGPIGMGWHYRRSYETVLVAHKGPNCRWYDTSDRVENVIRPGMLEKNKIIPNAKQHPTEKLVGLSSRFLRLHAQPSHLILDPFMGSGTTGVSAVGMGMRFIGIEIDPHWFKVACRRIENEHNQPRLVEIKTQIPTQEILL